MVEENGKTTVTFGLRKRVIIAVLIHATICLACLIVALCLSPHDANRTQLSHLFLAIGAFGCGIFSGAQLQREDTDND